MPKSQESLQKGFEAKNQAIHKINELAQRWEDRITASNLRIAERFLNLELHILLHLFIAETNKVWGVLLEKESLAEPIGVQNEIVREREQSTVLVDAVKLVNSPERTVSAFVWFEPIESFYNLWPDTIYNSGLTGFVTSDILRDRKTVTLGDLAAIDEQEVAHQVIESASQIVGNVPNASKNLSGKTRHVGQKLMTSRDSAKESQIFSSPVLKALSTLRVFIGNNYCKAFQSENVGSQILEVLFGPLNFYADQNDSVVGSKQKLTPLRKDSSKELVSQGYYRHYIWIRNNDLRLPGQFSAIDKKLEKGLKNARA